MGSPYAGLPGSPFGPVIDKPGAPGAPGGPGGPGTGMYLADSSDEDNPGRPGAPSFPGMPSCPRSPLSPFSPLAYSQNVIQLALIFDNREQNAIPVCNHFLSLLFHLSYREDLVDRLGLDVPVLIKISNLRLHY